MTEKRAYNLRSGGSEAVIPDQFEVSDVRFMSTLLQCQQETSKSGQVSDSDSDSENNDSMSNVEIDTEQTGVSESTEIDKQVLGSSIQASSSSSSVISQQEINLKILAQLGSITERLDMIKGKNCKKSNDGLNGHKNTFWLVLRRNVYSMISYLCLSGWLGFVAS